VKHTVLDENEDVQLKKQALHQSLRDAIASDKSVRDVVDLVYKHYECKPGAYEAARVMLALQKAFDLGFFDVKPVAEAKCVGSSGHSDEEIDRILRPVLRDAMKRREQSGKGAS